MLITFLRGVATLILFLGIESSEIRKTAKSLGLKVINGSETGVNEYPYMALLWAYNVVKWEPICGGSIITPRHILTAAHCTFGRSPNTLRVSVGEHDYTRHDETAFQRMMCVSNVMSHSLYNIHTYRHDIALVVTCGAIPLSQAVRPVSLPKGRLCLVGETLLLTGWGMVSYEGERSSTLMNVDLRVQPLSVCHKFFRKHISIVDPTQLCTFVPHGGPYKGDSGGPLVWMDPETNEYVQAGVVSFMSGIERLARPTVSTDVSAYINWIRWQIEEAIHFDCP